MTSTLGTRILELMRLRHLFLPLALVALLSTACSGEDAPDEITPLPDNVADAPEEVTVTLRMVDFGTELVTVGNTGQESGATGVLRICQNDTCFDPPIDNLDFGSVAVIDASELGLIDPAGGEVALFSETAGGTELVSYVAWGSGEHANMQLAIDQSVWDSDQTIQGAGVFLQARSPVPDKASDWLVN